MTTAVWIYLSYTLVSVLMTAWVARTLHKNGRIFLLEAFNDNEEMADSVNHLLVVGFYLINLGLFFSSCTMGRSRPILKKESNILPPSLGSCCWLSVACTFSICSTSTG